MKLIKILVYIYLLKLNDPYTIFFVHIIRENLFQNSRGTFKDLDIGFPFRRYDFHTSNVSIFIKFKQLSPKLKIFFNSNFQLFSLISIAIDIKSCFMTFLLLIFSYQILENDNPSRFHFRIDIL